MTVIVFGSMGNDFFVPSGRDTLPSPGETIVSRGAVELTPGGGKGMNQAVAAARAGSEVYLAGAIGDDSFGAAVLNTLKNEGVNADMIKKGALATGQAFIFVDNNGENAIINAAGANFEARADQVPDRLLDNKATVIMQMEVTPEENWKLIGRAKALGAKTILNFAPATTLTPDKYEDFTIALGKLDYLVMNENEAQKVAKILNIDAADKDYAKISEMIVKQYPGLTCITTLGSEGCLAVSAVESLTVPPYGPIKVVSEAGAGDAHLGGFGAAIDQGFSLDAALQRGNVTGALACTEMGCQTALPYKQAIDKAMLAGMTTRAVLKKKVGLNPG